MPTIQVFKNFRICIYFGDHNPPHFHIVAKEFSTKIQISDLSVMAGSAPNRTVKQACAWAAKNRAFVWQKCYEIAGGS